MLFQSGSSLPVSLAQASFNAIGTPATQSDFARWGYPRWWAALPADWR
jgi:hypothetical protein